MRVQNAPVAFSAPASEFWGLLPEVLPGRIFSVLGPADFWL
jgi:hypothetical protein